MATSDDDDVFKEVLRRLARVKGDDDDKLRAAEDVVQRLRATRLRLPPQERAKSKEPRGYYSKPIHVDAFPADLLVVKAISRTYGASQFGVTRRGRLFTTDADGYSPPTGRFEWVGGLSDVLDQVAEYFYK